MMDIPKRVSTTRLVRHKVESVIWRPPVSSPSLHAYLKCSVCKAAYTPGQPYAVAWMSLRDSSRSYRLCEACGRKAESEISA